MKAKTGRDRSYFKGGAYSGYHVYLQLVRENPDIEPFTISNPGDVYRFLEELRHADRERCYSLHMDVRHRIIACEEVSVGSVSQAVVHPREVYKSALLTSAADIILAHNHPSGDPAPSTEDVLFTRKLRQAGDMLGIPLVDSIIIGGSSYFSFAQSEGWTDPRGTTQVDAP